MELDYQAMEIKQEVEDFDEIGISTFPVGLGIKIGSSTSTNEISNRSSDTETDIDKQSLENRESSVTDTKKHIKVEGNMLPFAVKTEEGELEIPIDSSTQRMLIEELYIKPDCDINSDEDSSPELDRESGELPELTEDTKKHIKVEEDMLAFDIKSEEQESGTCIDSLKLRALTEEFYLKPDTVVSDDENFSAALDRVSKKEFFGEEHEEIQTMVDKGPFICHHCNFIVHGKKDLINHINVGNCHSKGHVKNTVTVRKRSDQEFICIQCHKIFKSKSSHDDHVIKNHEECYTNISSKIHQCNHCSYKTTKFFHYSRHMWKHPETRCTLDRNLCIHCDAIFISKQALDDHIIKNHHEHIGTVSSKIHQCKYCSYKTTNSSKLGSHMGKHPESGCIVKQYVCLHCDKIFKSKMTLDDHVVKKHTEFIATVSSKIHQCEHCTYKTTYSFLIARHMRTHTETENSVNQMQCLHCEATFDRKGSLDDHVIKKHTEFIASVSSKIHQCEYCSYKTTRSSLFTGHMRRHPESGRSLKQHLCIHCRKTFRSKMTLDDHIIKNHAEFIASVSSKIHKCKYCSYQTTHSSLLANHMSKHSESGCSAKRFPCIHCEKTFQSKMAFDDHVIKNHEELIASVSSRIHQCKYCSYKTTHSTYLAKHTETHPESGCKRYLCNYCEVTFNKQIALDNHVIKNHTEFIASVSSKIHECKYCSYKTAYSCLLTRHIRKHTDSEHSVENSP